MTKSRNRHLSFPFRIGADGRASTVSSNAEHVRDEIIQLILTSPGERLFLPEFGGGLKRFVFGNVDEPTIAMAKTALAQNLNNWLHNRIIVEGLDLEIENEKIILTLLYRVVETNETDTIQFETGVE